MYEKEYEVGDIMYCALHVVPRQVGALQASTMVMVVMPDVEYADEKVLVMIVGVLEEGHTQNR